MCAHLPALAVWFCFCHSLLWASCACPTPDGVRSTGVLSKRGRSGPSKPAASYKMVPWTLKRILCEALLLSIIVYWRAVVCVATFPCQGKGRSAGLLVTYPSAFLETEEAYNWNFSFSLCWLSVQSFSVVCVVCNTPSSCCALCSSQLQQSKSAVWNIFTFSSSYCVFKAAFLC